MEKLVDYTAITKEGTEFHGQLQWPKEISYPFTHFVTMLHVQGHTKRTQIRTNDFVCEFEMWGKRMKSLTKYWKWSVMPIEAIGHGQSDCSPFSARSQRHTIDFELFFFSLHCCYSHGRTRWYSSEKFTSAFDRWLRKSGVPLANIHRATH